MFEREMEPNCFYCCRSNGANQTLLSIKALRTVPHICMQDPLLSFACRFEGSWTLCGRHQAKHIQFNIQFKSECHTDLSYPVVSAEADRDTLISPSCFFVYHLITVAKMFSHAPAMLVLYFRSGWVMSPSDQLCWADVTSPNTRKASIVNIT